MEFWYRYCALYSKYLATKCGSGSAWFFTKGSLLPMGRGYLQVVTLTGKYRTLLCLATRLKKTMIDVIDADNISRHILSPLAFLSCALSTCFSFLF